MMRSRNSVIFFAFLVTRQSQTGFRNCRVARISALQQKHDEYWRIRTLTQGLRRRFGDRAHSGADLVGPPQLRIYGMKEFEVRDLDGFVICFGEEVKTSPMS